MHIPYDIQHATYNKCNVIILYMKNVIYDRV